MEEDHVQYFATSPADHLRVALERYTGYATWQKWRRRVEGKCCIKIESVVVTHQCKTYDAGSILVAVWHQYVMVRGRAASEVRGGQHLHIASDNVRCQLAC